MAKKNKNWKYLVGSLSVVAVSAAVISAAVSCSSVNSTTSTANNANTTTPGSIKVSVISKQNNKDVTLSATNGKYDLDYGQAITLSPDITNIPYATYSYKWITDSSVALSNPTSKDLSLTANSNATYYLEIINDNNQSQIIKSNVITININDYSINATLTSKQVANNTLVLPTNYESTQSTFSLNLQEIVNNQTITLTNANTYGSFKLYNNDNAIISCPLVNLNDSNWTFSLSNAVLSQYSSIYAIVTIDNKTYTTPTIKILKTATNTQILQNIVDQLTNSTGFLNATKAIGQVKITNSNVQTDLTNYLNNAIKNGFNYQANGYSSVQITANDLNWSDLTLNDNTNTGSVKLTYNNASITISINDFYTGTLSADQVANALTNALSNDKNTIDASSAFGNVSIDNDALPGMITNYLNNKIGNGLTIKQDGYTPVVVKKDQVTYKVIPDASKNQVQVNVTYTDNNQTGNATITINNFHPNNLSASQIVNALCNHFTNDTGIIDASNVLPTTTITANNLTSQISTYLNSLITNQGYQVKLTGFLPVTVLASQVSYQITPNLANNEATVTVTYEDASKSIVFNDFYLANLTNQEIVNDLINKLSNNGIITANDTITSLKNISITDSSVASKITDYLSQELGSSITINVPGYHVVKIGNGQVKFKVSVNENDNDATVSVTYLPSASQSSTGTITVKDFYLNSFTASQIVNKIAISLSNANLTIDASQNTSLKNIYLLDDNATTSIQSYFNSLIPADGWTFSANGYEPITITKSDFTFNVNPNLNTNTAQVIINYDGQTATININDFSEKSLSANQIITWIVNQITNNAILPASNIKQLNNISIVQPGVKDILSKYIAKKCANGFNISVPGYTPVNVNSSQLTNIVSLDETNNTATIQLTYSNNNENATSNISVIDFYQGSLSADAIAQMVANKLTDNEGFIDASSAFANKDILQVSTSDITSYLQSLIGSNGYQIAEVGNKSVTVTNSNLSYQISFDDATNNATVTLTYSNGTKTGTASFEINNFYQNQLTAQQVINWIIENRFNNKLDIDASDIASLENISIINSNLASILTSYFTNQINLPCTISEAGYQSVNLTSQNLTFAITLNKNANTASVIMNYEDANATFSISNFYLQTFSDQTIVNDIANILVDDQASFNAKNIQSLATAYITNSLSNLSTSYSNYFNSVFTGDTFSAPGYQSVTVSNSELTYEVTSTDLASDSLVIELTYGTASTSFKVINVAQANMSSQTVLHDLVNTMTNELSPNGTTNTYNALTSKPIYKDVLTNVNLPTLLHSYFASLIPSTGLTYSETGYLSTTVNTSDVTISIGTISLANNQVTITITYDGISSSFNLVNFKKVSVPSQTIVNKIAISLSNEQLTLNAKNINALASAYITNSLSSLTSAYSNYLSSIYPTTTYTQTGYASVSVSASDLTFSVTEVNLDNDSLTLTITFNGASATIKVTNVPLANSSDLQIAKYIANQIAPTGNLDASNITNLKNIASNATNLNNLVNSYLDNVIANGYTYQQSGYNPINIPASSISFTYQFTNNKLTVNVNYKDASYPFTISNFQMMNVNVTSSITNAYTTTKSNNFNLAISLGNNSITQTSITNETIAWYKVDNNGDASLISNQSTNSLSYLATLGNNKIYAQISFDYNNETFSKLVTSTYSFDYDQLVIDDSNSNSSYGATNTLRINSTQTYVGFANPSYQWENFDATNKKWVAYGSASATPTQISIIATSSSQFRLVVTNTANTNEVLTSNTITVDDSLNHPVIQISSNANSSLINNNNINFNNVNHEFTFNLSFSNDDLKITNQNIGNATITWNSKVNDKVTVLSTGNANSSSMWTYQLDATSNMQVYATILLNGTTYTSNIWNLVQDTLSINPTSSDLINSTNNDCTIKANSAFELSASYSWTLPASSTYEWFSSTNNGKNWTNLNNNSANLKVNDGISTNTLYKVELVNAATTNNDVYASLTYNVQPVTNCTISLNNTTVAYGQQFTIDSNISSLLTNPTYQWYVSSNGTTFTKINNATNSTYSGTLIANDYYQLQVSDHGVSFTSNIIKLNLDIKASVSATGNYASASSYMINYNAAAGDPTFSASFSSNDTSLSSTSFNTQNGTIVWQVSDYGQNDWTTVQSDDATNQAAYNFKLDFANYNKNLQVQCYLEINGTKYSATAWDVALCALNVTISGNGVVGNSVTNPTIVNILSGSSYNLNVQLVNTINNQAVSFNYPTDNYCYVYETSSNGKTDWTQNQNYYGTTYSDSSATSQYLMIAYQENFKPWMQVVTKTIQINAFSQSCTITSSTANPSIGQTYTLSSNINSYFTNYSYQWYSSTNDGSTWNKVQDGTNSTLSATCNGTITNYKLVVSDGPSHSYSFTSNIITINPNITTTLSPSGNYANSTNNLISYLPSLGEVKLNINITSGNNTVANNQAIASDVSNITWYIAQYGQDQYMPISSENGFSYEFTPTYNCSIHATITIGNQTYQTGTWNIGLCQLSASYTANNKTVAIPSSNSSITFSAKTTISVTLNYVNTINNKVISSFDGTDCSYNWSFSQNGQNNTSSVHTNTAKFTNLDATTQLNCQVVLPTSNQITLGTWSFTIYIEQYADIGLKYTQSNNSVINQNNEIALSYINLSNNDQVISVPSAFKVTSLNIDIMQNGNVIYSGNWSQFTCSTSGVTLNLSPILSAYTNNPWQVFTISLNNINANNTDATLKESTVNAQTFAYTGVNGTNYPSIAAYYNNNFIMQMNSGSTGVTIKPTGTIPSGTTITWQQDVDGTFVDVGSGNSYTIPNNAYQGLEYLTYRALWSNGSVSNTVILQPLSLGSISINVSGQATSTGNNYQFNVDSNASLSLSNNSLNFSDVAYQWQYKSLSYNFGSITSDGAWVNISGNSAFNATNLSLLIANPNASGSVRLVAYNPNSATGTNSNNIVNDYSQLVVSNVINLYTNSISGVSNVCNLGIVSPSVSINNETITNVGKCTLSADFADANYFEGNNGLTINWYYIYNGKTILQQSSLLWEWQNGKFVQNDTCNFDFSTGTYQVYVTLVWNNEGDDYSNLTSGKLTINNASISSSMQDHYLGLLDTKLFFDQWVQHNSDFNSFATSWMVGYDLDTSNLQADLSNVNISWAPMSGDSSELGNHDFLTITATLNKSVELEGYSGQGTTMTLSSGDHLQWTLPYDEADVSASGNTLSFNPFNSTYAFGQYSDGNYFNNPDTLPNPFGLSITNSSGDNVLANDLGYLTSSGFASQNKVIPYNAAGDLPINASGQMNITLSSSLMANYLANSFLVNWFNNYPSSSSNNFTADNMDGWTLWPYGSYTSQSYFTNISASWTTLSSDASALGGNYSYLTFKATLGPGDDISFAYNGGYVTVLSPGDTFTWVLPFTESGVSTTISSNGASNLIINLVKSNLISNGSINSSVNNSLSVPFGVTIVNSSGQNVMTSGSDPLSSKYGGVINGVIPFTSLSNIPLNSSNDFNLNSSNDPNNFPNYYQNSLSNN